MNVGSNCLSDSNFVGQSAIVEVLLLAAEAASSVDAAGWLQLVGSCVDGHRLRSEGVAHVDGCGLRAGCFRGQRPESDRNRAGGSGSQGCVGTDCPPPVGPQLESKPTRAKSAVFAPVRAPWVMPVMFTFPVFVNVNCCGRISRASQNAETGSRAVACLGSGSSLSVSGLRSCSALRPLR